MTTKEDDPIICADGVQRFLSEQRERLKKLAEKNVEIEWTADTFIASVRTLRQQAPIRQATAMTTLLQTMNP